MFKAIAYTVCGVVAVVTALGVIGYLATKPKDKPTAKSQPEPAVEPTSSTPAQPEAETPVAEAGSTPAQEEPKTTEAIVPSEQAAQQVSDLQKVSNTQPKEQLVKMKVVDPSDPAVGVVEKHYLALVRALHSHRLQGEVWHGTGEVPAAEVIELRGRTIDLMTALRSPRLYFDAKRPGITLAYQYTTRKSPIIFLQVNEFIYVLGGDEKRFLSSVPHPEEILVEPNGYLAVALSVLFDTLGMNEDLH